MDEQKNNVRIIITEKADNALAELEKKFNLFETEEESIKRNNSGQYSKMVFVSVLSKDFKKGTVLEKDLPAYIQKDLGVSPQIAGDIAKEIVTKIIPLLEKISESEIKKQNLEEEILKTPPNNISEIPNKDIVPVAAQSMPTIAPEIKPPMVPPAKKISKLKKTVSDQILEKPIGGAKKQPSKPDNYRESID